MDLESNLRCRVEYDWIIIICITIERWSQNFEPKWKFLCIIIIIWTGLDTKFNVRCSEWANASKYESMSSSTKWKWRKKLFLWPSFGKLQQIVTIIHSNWNWNWNNLLTKFSNLIPSQSLFVASLLKIEQKQKWNKHKYVYDNLVFGIYVCRMRFIFISSKENEKKREKKMERKWQ